MRVVPDEVATGFGYVVDQNAIVVNEDGAYAVHMTIDASVSYPAAASLRPALVIGLSAGPKGVKKRNEAPIPAVEVPLWSQIRSIPGGGRLLRMRLDCPRDTEIVSLATLAHRIQANEATSRDLEHLDILFDRLLAVTGELHRFERSVGLLDPGNVFYFEGPRGSASSDSLQILLPDLNFRPTKGATRWIVARDAYDFLWSPEYDREEFERDEDETLPDTEASTESRHRYLLRQLSKETFDSQRDLRVIARMMGWVLTGKKITGQFVDAKAVGGRWDWIRKVLASELPMVSTELRGELNLGGNSPSNRGERGEREREQSPRGRGLPLAGLLSLVLIAAGGGLYQFQGWLWPPPSPPPKTSSLCPQCPGESKLHQHLLTHQEPLVREFLRKYPDISQGDHLLVEDVAAEGGKRELSEKLYLDQMANLEQQLSQIEAGIVLVGDSRSPEETRCLEDELRRFHQAWLSHFFVVDPRFDRLNTNSANAKLTVGMQRSAIKFLSLLDQYNLRAPLHPQTKEQLSATVGKKMRDSKNMQSASLFEKVDDAKQYLGMVQAYADPLPGS